MRKVLLLTLFVLCLASPSWAATFYVATTGDNTRSCNTAQTITTPKQTFLSAIACLTNPGDILYARAGTYTEAQPLYLVGKNGQPGLVYTISGYQNEVVTLTPSSATVASRRAFIISASSYITISNMVLDGINAITDVPVNRIEGSHHIIIKNTEIKRWLSSVLVTQGSNFITLSNNSIHDITDTCAALHRPYGIYFHDGNDGVIEKNEIYNNVGGGVHAYPGSINNLTVRYNNIHNNGTCAATSFGGVLIGTDNTQTNTNALIYNNLIHDNGPSATSDVAHGIVLYTNPSGAKIYNNTIYANDGNGILFSSTSSNTEVRNNIITANTSAEVSPAGTNNTYTYNACTSAETCTTANKTTITAITTCTVSTSNFVHKLGSTCIDVGTALSGYAFNGSAPDLGAFETPVCGTAEVGATDATSMIITCTNNRYPPLLPSSGSLTTFTATSNGANKPISGCVKAGDNIIDCTFTSDVVAGQTILLSYAPGNVTDSSLIGNTLNQPLLAITNLSVTNNVGVAPPTFAFTQATFEFHNLRGTEAAPVIYRTEDANIQVIPGGAVRLRVAVTCTVDDCPADAFIPFYIKNSTGSYVVVPDTYDANNIAFIGTASDPDIPASGTDTTEQLSTTGTFQACALVRTSNAIPNVDMAEDEKTECEYAFTISPNATPGDTYDIRVYHQDFSGLSAYTVTPRITVANPQYGIGF